MTLRNYWLVLWKGSGLSMKCKRCKGLHGRAVVPTLQSHFVFSCPIRCTVTTSTIPASDPSRSRRCLKDSCAETHVMVITATFAGELCSPFPRWASRASTTRLPRRVKYKCVSLLLNVSFLNTLLLSGGSRCYRLNARVIPSYNLGPPFLQGLAPVGTGWHRLATTLRNTLTG